MTDLKYRRILLKISGEGLGEKGQTGLSGAALRHTAEQIRRLNQLGVETAVVLGAGNLIRGEQLSQATGIHRVTGDQMGMLATVINALALQDVLEAIDVPTRVLSAIGITALCEPFIKRRALKHLQSGRVLLLAGGTGNPYFTTDTCAALRAAEIQADLIVKATKVDGVYSADPVKDPSARRYDHLTFAQILHENLRVMDHTAVSMCRDNNMNIVVCNLWQADALTRLVQGEKVGSFITSEK